MPKICVLRVSSQLFISFYEKSYSRERILREPSIVDPFAVFVDCFPFARKLAVRGAREKAARLCVRDLSLVVGGLAPGKRPGFLCGPEDRHKHVRYYEIIVIFLTLLNSVNKYYTHTYIL